MEKLFGASGWRKSTRCETSACVEVSETPNEVQVRDTTNTIITLTKAQWKNFTEGINHGNR